MSEHASFDGEPMSRADWLMLEAEANYEAALDSSGDEKLELWQKASELASKARQADIEDKTLNQAQPEKEE